jgi:hypothetical protein
VKDPEDPYAAGTCRWWHLLGEHTIRATFSGWQLADLRRLRLASDTRTMPALMALLIRRNTSWPADAEPSDGRDISDHDGHN